MFEIDAAKQASVAKMSYQGQVEKVEEDSCADGLLEDIKSLDESVKKFET